MPRTKPSCACSVRTHSCFVRFQTFTCKTNENLGSDIMFKLTQPLQHVYIEVQHSSSACQLPPHRRSQTAAWTESWCAWPCSSPHPCVHPGRPGKAWQTPDPAWWRSWPWYIPGTPQTDGALDRSFEELRTQAELCVTSCKEFHCLCWQNLTL